MTIYDPRLQFHPRRESPAEQQAILLLGCVSGDRRPTQRPDRSLQRFKSPRKTLSWWLKIRCIPCTRPHELRLNQAACWCLMQLKQLEQHSLGDLQQLLLPLTPTPVSPVRPPENLQRWPDKRSKRRLSRPCDPFPTSAVPQNPLCPFPPSSPERTVVADPLFSWKPNLPTAQHPF